jgi:hypothetical protein
MTTLDLHMNGDNCWPDLSDGNYLTGKIASIALLHDATIDGNPTVTIRIEIADGGTVLAETTYRIFESAAAALRGAVARAAEGR